VLHCATSAIQCKLSGSPSPRDDRRQPRQTEDSRAGPVGTLRRPQTVSSASSSSTRAPCVDRATVCYTVSRESVEGDFRYGARYDGAPWAQKCAAGHGRIEIGLAPWIVPCGAPRGGFEGRNDLLKRPQKTVPPNRTYRSIPSIWNSVRFRCLAGVRCGTYRVVPRYDFEVPTPSDCVFD
jgi:hypothetical protein